MVFHRDPFLVPCYLILIFVICFLLTSLLTLQIMLMTPLLTNVINTDNLISNMELTVEKILNWFEFNNLKANASKCDFFWSPYQHTSININGSVINSSNSEKLLGITIDSDLTFEIHYVEKLAKNCMRYLEFHNIYHNTKSGFYSKHL